MGLIADKLATETIKKKLKEKGKISVWKFLAYDGEKLVSPYVSHNSPNWMKPGVIHSDRAEVLKKYKDRKGQPRKPTHRAPNEKRGEIQHGFHVYTTYQAAKTESSFGGYVKKAVVRFEAYKEDFIAAGTHYSTSHHVVFAKLTLTKAVLDKTLKQLRKK